ncbi:zinc finger protein 488 [Pelobates fuscus]|uniref:zinc finger protein 488 n=1 Tax=Pelobates fuscus TaxID=191477 RepID=UPI002FE47242
MQREEVQFRGVHPYQKEEQLLVWYDGQSCRILGFQELRDGLSTQGFQCPECEKEFQGKLSFLSHNCFLLPKRKDGTTVKLMRRGTNFHSLAHDMEIAGDEALKSILLEKTNCLDEAFTSNKRDEGFIVSVVSSSRSSAKRILKAEHKQSAFSEFQGVKSVLNTEKDGRDTAGSAFSPVPARQKMACRSGAESFCDIFSGVTGMRIMDFCNSFSSPYEYLSLSNSYSGHPLPEVRQKPEVVTQSNSPQLLPPTFTPLGVTAQNWCAKCRLSFSMTSDLVLHMRSRHKREAGVETQRKRRRELQLSCPVCYACFRERHHLSRHMTSHC